jgi:hypothetical protein
MTPVRIRPFARGDRDQLAALVNAHLAAVTPGASISVQALLSHLERQPAEFIVDPWVTERVTLVAEQRHRIVAAAHLLRYGADEPVGSFYRDTAEIRWLVCYLPAPFWPDAGEAGTQLIQACLAVLGTWQVRQSFAAGWLDLGGIGRLMAYVSVDATPAEAAFWSAVSFSELTRTVHGLTRPG